MCSPHFLVSRAHLAAPCLHWPHGTKGPSWFPALEPFAPGSNSGFLQLLSQGTLSPSHFGWLRVSPLASQFSLHGCSLFLPLGWKEASPICPVLALAKLLPQGLHPPLILPGAHGQIFWNNDCCPPDVRFVSAGSHHPGRILKAPRIWAGVVAPQPCCLGLPEGSL